MYNAKVVNRMILQSSLCNDSHLRYCQFFWYRHSVVFANHCTYLLSMRTQLLENYIFNGHLLHVYSVLRHNQFDFTKAYMEMNTDVDLRREVVKDGPSRRYSFPCMLL